MNPITLETVKIRLRKSDSGRIGSRGAPLGQNEPGRCHHAEDEQHEHRRRPPAVGIAAEARVEHDRRQPAGEQRHADVVDRALDTLRAPVQHQLQHDERDDPDRDVDVEDPVPREMVDEEPAEQGPDHRRDAEDGAHQAGVAPALARRDDIADHRLRRHHQRAAAQALQTAKHDQLRHVLAQPAQDRTDQEHDERDLQHELAPVHVTKLARDRCRDRRRQQIRRHHPWQTREAAEVAGDRRQRRRDDRRVERRHQHHEHQGPEHGTDTSPRGRRGLRRDCSAHTAATPFSESHTQDLGRTSPHEDEGRRPRPMSSRTSARSTIEMPTSRARCRPGNEGSASVEKRLVTRYAMQSTEAADENQRRVEGVFAELEATKPDNVSYLVLRLADDSFVHVSFHDHGEDDVNPIASTAAFAHFQDGHADRRARCGRSATRDARRRLCDRDRLTTFADRDELRDDGSRPAASHRSRACTSPEAGARPLRGPGRSALAPRPTCHTRSSFARRCGAGAARAEHSAERPRRTGSRSAPGSRQSPETNSVAPSSRCQQLLDQLLAPDVAAVGIRPLAPRRTVRLDHAEAALRELGQRGRLARARHAGNEDVPHVDHAIPPDRRRVA